MSEVRLRFTRVEIARLADAIEDQISAQQGDRDHELAARRSLEVLGELIGVLDPLLGGSSTYVSVRLTAQQVEELRVAAEVAFATARVPANREEARVASALESALNKIRVPA